MALENKLGLTSSADLAHEEDASVRKRRWSFLKAECLTSWKQGGFQTNGASRQLVGLTFMRRYKLLVPNDDILEAFADKVLLIIEQKRLLHQKNLNLAAQSNILLSRLMSGKLEV